MLEIPIIPSDVAFQFRRLQFQLQLGFAASVKVAVYYLHTNCVPPLGVQRNDTYSTCPDSSYQRALHLTQPDPRS
jgi:hypothetical protein